VDRSAAGVKPRIFDPSFRYTRAVETDIRKTFARIRKQQAEQQKKQQELDAQTALKVRKLGAARDPK
jgi:hypothetical protein